MSQPLSLVPSCELPTPDGEESPLGTSAPDQPGEYLKAPAEALPDPPAAPTLTAHALPAGLTLAAASSAPSAGPAPAAASCASCMQQQQHTHSRNSSNTSGDMSSKVRPHQHFRDNLLHCHKLYLL